MSKKQRDILMLQWIQSKGIEMDGCGLVHQGPCTIQFITKLFTVSKLGAKYYLPFHLIPLIMRIRKSKDMSPVFGIIKKSLIEYVKSVFFMMFLVGGSKATLCIGSSKIPIRLNGRYLLLTNWAPPLSILLQSRSRRSEIGYFVLAKAIGSIYLMLKRRGYCDIGVNEGVWLHVLLMSVCYFIYNKYSQHLKYKQLYEFLWGEE